MNEDGETFAVERSFFMTSQSEGIRTEMKSSKLFELTLESLNGRCIFLLYALKSSEIGQFAHVKAGLFHLGHIHIQHFECLENRINLEFSLMR